MDDKKCPKCREEMDKGYLVAKGYISSPVEQWRRWKTPSLLTKKLGGGRGVFAYKCRGCDCIELFEEDY